nr:50S ribosomal protein L22 [Desulfobacterales bacterium]
MEVKSQARYVRISPTKVRKVANTVKGKQVEDALSILKFMPHRSARILSKVIQSAVANADQNTEVDIDMMRVKNIIVDQGPTLKRFRARAMGRATRILKRTSHIKVILAE